VLELREEDFASFFAVPFRVYPASSPYVSPMKADLERFLDPGANPLWKHEGARRVLTAHRGGAPVGRIVAHVHHASNRRHGWRRGYFGFLDCADDVEVAELLLGGAEAFARGLSAIHDHLRAAFNSIGRALTPLARAAAALWNRPNSRSPRCHHRRPARLCIDGRAYRRRTRGRR